MRIIYCDSVIDPKQIEPDYESEKRAALHAGFQFSLISYEELLEGNIGAALRFVKEAHETETAMYRGWMMTPKQYQWLYEALLT